MHKIQLRKTLGISSMLALFLSTLFISAFGSMLLMPPAPAHALESNGTATWVDPWTITYQDTRGHSLTLVEDSSGDNKGSGCSRTPEGSGQCTTFNSTESVAQYIKRTNDQQICFFFGKDSVRASNIYISGISDPSTMIATEKSSGYRFYDGGPNNNAICHGDSGSQITFANSRPTKPTDCSASSSDQTKYNCKGSITWATQSSNIVTYTGQADYSQFGVGANQEFDETALNGTKMTLTSSASPTNPGCADARSYVTIDPYQTYVYAELFVPIYTAAGDAAPATCTMQHEAWLNVIGKPTNPQTNDNYTASWQDNNTITLSSSSGGVTTDMLDWGLITSINDPAPVFTNVALVGNFMTLNAPSSCSTKKSVMQINPYLVSQYVLVTVFNRACTLASNFWVKLSNLNPNSPISSGTTDTNINTKNCPVSGDGDWLFCLFIGIFRPALDFLTKVIIGMLYTPTAQIFTKQFQGAFNSFRNIAIALLAVAGVVMVGAQAIGLEIVSAYSLKKILPPLVVSMIIIAILWPILQFTVTFFNDLGIWTNQIILSAVNINPGGAPLSSYTGLSATVFAVGAGGALLFSTGIVVSLLGTLFLALFVGFIVLAIRQLIILVCILIAPLAVAAFIFPGTKKIGVFIRDTFLGAGLAFPVIMAMFGAGQALSNVAGAAANSSTGTTSITYKFLSVLCLGVPPFLTGFAIQMGSGLLRTAHGLVSGGKITKGISGAMSEYRGKKLAQRGHAAASGQFFRSTGIGAVDALGDRVNRGFRGAYLFGQNPFSRGQRNALGANQDMTKALESLEKDPDIKPGTANEDFFLAGMRGTWYTNRAGRRVQTTGSEASIRDYYESKGMTGVDLTRSIGQTRLMQRKMGQRSFEIAGAIATAGSGTGYKGGVGEMLETISRVAGGDKLLAQQMLGNAKKAAGAANRLDLSGASFTSLYGALQAHMDTGAPIDDTELTLEAMKANDMITNLRARKSSVDNMVKATERRLDDINGVATPTNAQQEERGLLTAMLKQARQVSTIPGYAAAEKAVIVHEAENRQFANEVGSTVRGRTVVEGVYDPAVNPPQPAVVNPRTGQRATTTPTATGREHIDPQAPPTGRPVRRGRGGPNPFGPGGPYFTP